MTRHSKKIPRQEKIRLLTIVLLLMLAIAMMLRPSLACQAALRGLELWWQVVAPSLLPFFFISELLLGMNISRYLSAAMSPLMRPLFNLPGCAALAVALGFCSGFPSGASITAALRRKKEITRAEGERMICFTNNAGPLYITVAVAGGLLHCPTAALLLAAVHYGGNLLIGVLLGLGARCRRCRQTAKTAPAPPEQPAASAADLGASLQNALKRSTANIISIGCLMAFFSVVSALITTLPAASLLPQALSQGFWEMSLGVSAIAGSALPLEQILPITAAIISFGGISVQMQVLAMIGDTDLRLTPYLICRLAHALFAYLAMAALCHRIALPSALFTGGGISRPVWLTALQLCLISLAALGLLSALMLRLSHCSHKS